MSVDLSSLLKRPAGKAIRPQALPVGNYPAIIKTYEYRKATAEDKSPSVRLGIGLTGWADNIQDDEKVQVDGEGVAHPIEITKKSLRRDFFLSDAALSYLDDLLKSCGLSAEGASYEDQIPKLVGCSVTAEVKQYVNQRTSEIGNDVGRLVGTEG